MLHTVNKSPFEKNTLDTCLRLARAGSCVLFIEDGVYGALNNTEFTARVKKAMRDKKFYALSADLNARGIEHKQLINGIEIIDYHGFVELAVKCDKVQSWF